MSKKKNFPTLKQAETIQEDIDQAREKKYKMLAIFTDGMPYHKDRYIREARKALEQHFFSAIEAGKRLIVLKEMCQQGEFVSALEQIGIPRTTAWRYMSITQRFCGLDSNLTEELGVTKLYGLLKAPEEEIQKLQDEGTFLDMDKEKLKVISTRELEERIKEHTTKLRDDIQEKDTRLKILYEDNRQQQKEIKRLKDDVIKASLQERPPEPIPEWWTRFTEICATFDDMIRLLAENPPDALGEDKERCRYVKARIDRQFFRAKQYLSGMPIDATEYLDKRDEKLAELERKGTFDFSKILNENGEYVEFEEDEN